MYKNKFFLLPVIFLIAIAFVKNLAKSRSLGQGSKAVVLHRQNGDQAINLFVTHGHCSTPFGGIVNRLQVNTPVRDDLANPLEAMEILFEIDPNSFNVCAGAELTARIKTPGLFIGKQGEKIHSDLLKFIRWEWIGIKWMVKCQ